MKKNSRTNSLWIAIIVFTCICPTVLQAAATEYFVRIEARVVAEKSPRGVAVVVEMLEPLVRSQSRPGSVSITVNCPIQDLQYWKTEITIGDTLWLEWRELQEPTRSWVLVGGKPGVYMLTVPDDGFSRLCRCSNKLEPQEASLTAVIELVDQSQTKGILCDGRSRNWLANRIPFLKGRMPSLPASVRLLVGWRTATNSDDSGENDSESLTQFHTYGESK